MEIRQALKEVNNKYLREMLEYNGYPTHGADIRVHTVHTVHTLNTSTLFKLNIMNVNANHDAPYFYRQLLFVANKSVTIKTPHISADR